MKLRRSLTKDASYRSAFAAFRRVPGLDDAEASLFASFHVATPSERWLRNQSYLQHAWRGVRGQ